jgi:hypothetical protein
MIRKIAFSGMLNLVTLVRTDISEDFSASTITSLYISSQRASVASCGYIPSSLILVTLMMEVLRSCETLVLARSTRRNIPKDAILHSYRREPLKLYIALTG